MHTTIPAKKYWHQAIDVMLAKLGYTPIDREPIVKISQGVTYLVIAQSQIAELISALEVYKGTKKNESTKK